MSETLNNNPPEQPTQLDPAMQSLADMAGQMGAEIKIGEKYYEQAKAEKERWVEEAKGNLAAVEGLKMEKLKKLTNPSSYATGGEPIYRPLDSGSEQDAAEFDEYKSRKIKQAKEFLQEVEADDLDKLAECFYNQEMIDGVAAKLENDEDFTNEQLEFLKISDMDMSSPSAYCFNINDFMVPERYYDTRHNLLWVPDDPNEWLDPKSDVDPRWKTVAKARQREMIRGDQAVLHTDEEIQKILENMAGRREANEFFGETNTNSETGEARTFGLEDNYPRLEGESEEDYATRLKKIGLKTRLAEKRQ